MSLRLGIDTGGTFTDAVLVDDNKTIIAAEKSLTTRFDLVIGIGEVIAKLPTDKLKQVSMVSLSTTLRLIRWLKIWVHPFAYCYLVIMTLK